MSLGSKVRPRTFGCVAMCRAVLFIFGPYCSYILQGLELIECKLFCLDLMRPRTFGCVAMGSTIPVNYCKCMLLLYSPLNSYLLYIGYCTLNKYYYYYYYSVVYFEVQIALIFHRVWSEQNASCFVWI